MPTPTSTLSTDRDTGHPAATGLTELALTARPAILVDRVRPEDLKTFDEIVGMQEKIWNYSKKDLIPSFTLQDLAHGCGQVMIAREGVKPVGFAFTLLRQDPDSGKLSFYLDLVGVDPAFQDRGIGMQLMEALKQDALNRKVDTIEWRYDGLETRNAKLYLAKIGARVVDFKANSYGIHEDWQSDGLPTDRFIVRWDLKRKAVPPPFPAEAPAAIGVDAQGAPTVNREVLTGGKEIAMAVPLHFQALKDQSREIGMQWITTVRETSEALLGSGYNIVAFRTGSSGYGEYLWSKNHAAQS